MMEGWEKVKIKNVAKIIGGYAFKSKDFNSDGIIPIIKIKSLKDRNINIEKGDLIDEKFLELNDKFHVKFNDILIALTGSHITLPASAVGRVAKSRHKFTLLLNQRVGKFVVDPEKCVHDFLYYFLITDYFFQSVGLRARGAANQANISGGDVEGIKINLPPLPIQQKIARILSPYDELIENNLQRIKLLEEMAQNTFNEWYSTIEEFEEVKLGSLFCYEIGGGWGNDELTDEFNKPAYVIRGTDIDELPNGKLEKVPFRYHKKSNLASRKLQDGDIIFEVSGGSSYEGVAKTLLVTEELLKQFDNAVMPASFCKLARPAKREYSSFLFLFLRFLRNIRGTEVFEIRSASNIVNYNWTAFLKFQKVKKPSDDVLKKFNAIVEPIYKQIYILGNQNQYLKEARDILLPRLMTGMIDVSEINTELSMAAEDGVEYGKVENI